MSEAAESSVLPLRSFGTALNAVVVGASGGIGGGLARALEAAPSVARVARLSRSGAERLHLDVEDEESIEAAAASLKEELGELHVVFVASGILHEGEALQPEKTWRHLSGYAMARAFRVNATGPALVAKHFLPLLARERKTAFAAISARVGSIEDNGLGGWHAYRASKAALNMILRTLSVELARRNPAALCVGLHPGTVDTELSKPFQRRVPEGKLSSPDQSACYLLEVLDGLGEGDSGKIFAWDGQEIPF